MELSVINLIARRLLCFRAPPRRCSLYWGPPRRIGHPPTIHADASLGFSVMAYQSKEIVFGHAEG